MQVGIIGCIIGFLVVIYLCYKDWSVYLATFVGACVVIAFNMLPFIGTLSGLFVDGMFVAIKSFFFMILFGCIQSQIYVESGAAFSIADTIMRKMLKQGASNTRKNVIAMAVLLAIGTILNLGGITASVVVVLMYPIALTVFEYCDIPKRFILGVLGACSYTFTLTMPGSPQVTNVAAMTSLGTSSWVAPIPGLVGAVVEIIVIIVLLNRFINKARKSDEHFALHPEDPHYDRESSRPGFLKSLLPMVLVFAAFNFLNININLCLLGSILLSLILFWPQLKARDIKLLLNKGANDSIHMTLTVAAICGFAGTVTGTDAFQSMLNTITSIDMPPLIICAVVVAVMCMLTGGSSTGQLISLPLIAPKLLSLGVNVGAIHRVACFAATTLDSMPYSGAILMLLPMCHMTLKEIYKPLFITTVVATFCGTVAVVLMCTLFPGLT